MSASTHSAQEYPHAVDLCAGCGGFSHGLQLVGYNVRAAFEVDPSAWYTYKVHIADHDDMALLSHDVTDVDPERVARVTDDVKFVSTGPPCQPWSSAGQRDPDDSRRMVAHACAEWITELEPEAFAFENVEGLRNEHPEALAALEDQLVDGGYQIQTVTLECVEYGVPQDRDRMFILGVRDDHHPPDQWAPPTLGPEDENQTTLGQFDNELAVYRTAGEALYDLPDPLPPQRPKHDDIHMVSVHDENRVTPHACGEFIERDGEEVKMWPNHIETNHQQSTRERYAEWPLGYVGNHTASRRLHPDEPAPTITVSKGQTPVHYQGQSPVHPDRDVDDVRRITVREAARLQTFPDHWCFAGTKLERVKQVANAVPPLLAAHVGDHLRKTVIDGQSPATQARASHRVATD